ncbi:redoxin domain-containing protein, partial [Pedobacter ginsenosidimutans]
MMKLRNIITCCLMITFTGASAQQVSIHGKFRSLQREVKVEDISEFQYLRPQDKNPSVKTDSLGNFSIAFNLPRPGYYRIGRNVLYLTPGDKLKVDISHLNPAQSVFKGRGSSKNIYLRDTPFPKGGSYLESGKSISADPGTQLKLILEKAVLRKLELNRLKGVSSQFRVLEAARIKADVINSITSVPYYAPRKLKLSADSAKSYIRTFAALAQPTLEAYSRDLKDPRFLQLVVFRDIVGQVAKKQGGESQSRMIDWIRADSLVQVMRETEDKTKIAAFSDRLDRIKYPPYRLAAIQVKNSLLHYGNGDPAIDFSAIELSGRTVRLSDLKGKVIFIDLWATWCGPCLQEMPAFEKLKAQYVGNSGVAFVSLSIDESTDGWKKNVASRKADGLQWHIARSMLKDYQVVNIPRTIIIGRDFKVASFQAPVPSSKENLELIDELLGGGPKGNSFSIDGRLNRVDPKGILFLSYIGKDHRQVLDSVRLEDGSFHFDGTVDETTQANLLLSLAGHYTVKKNADQTDIFIGNKALVIKGADSIATAEILGDDENLANQQFKQKFGTLVKAQRSLLYLLTPDKRADTAFISDIRRKNQNLVFRQRALQRDFVLKNTGLMASLAVLRSYAGPIIDVDEVAPLYNALSAGVKQSIAGKQFGDAIKILNNIAVGQQAPDFKLPDTLGRLRGLDSFRGKYVLLDFWASWCAPCRAENPNIISQYKKYKDRNFEVLGISLDVANSKNAWLKAVKDDGLEWTNLSDL